VAGVTDASVARQEREALCNLALELGPEAPTLCGDWTVQELVAHLVVRERHPVGASGITIKPLAGLHDSAVARVARKEQLADLVGKVRDGFSYLKLPGIDPLVNTLEFFVHHEDIRRAQPGWEARDLDGRTAATLWKAVGTAGKGLIRPAGVPVTIVNAATGSSAVLRRGDDPVTITGEPAELVMFVYGRSETRGLQFDGPEESVAKLRAASLGI
jgi:uncharacterized protein (TIGR03085 family)